MRRYRRSSTLYSNIASCLGAAISALGTDFLALSALAVLVLLRRCVGLTELLILEIWVFFPDLNSGSSNGECDEKQHPIKKSCNLSLDSGAWGHVLSNSKINKTTTIRKNNKVIKVTITGNIRPEGQDLFEINPSAPANNLNICNVSGALSTPLGLSILLHLNRYKVWSILLVYRLIVDMQHQ